MCTDYPSRNLERLVPLRDLVLILIVVVLQDSRDLYCRSARYVLAE